MNLSARMFHTLYRTAWLESEARRKEAEEAEKQAREEERKAKRNPGGGGNPSSMSSRQAIDQMRGISGDELEELAEETGLI